MSDSNLKIVSPDKFKDFWFTYRYVMDNPSSISFIPDQYISNEIKSAYLMKSEEDDRFNQAPESWFNDAFQYWASTIDTKVFKFVPTHLQIEDHAKHYLKNNPDGYEHVNPLFRDPVDLSSNPVAKYAFHVAGENMSVQESIELSVPPEYMIGEELVTYISDGEGVSVESTVTLEQHHIIACRPSPIGKDDLGRDAHRLWAIPSEEVREKFGEEIIKTLISSDRFVPHEYTSTMKVLKLDQNLIDNILDKKGIKELPINVEWSTKPVILKEGDYIADNGKPILADEIKDYSPVDEIKGKVRNRDSNNEINL